MKLLHSYFRTLLLAFTVIISACCIFNANTALAGQVYKCVNSEGRKVFQQVPCQNNKTSTKTNGSTPAHMLIKDMRVLVSEGLIINSAIGPSLDAIKQCDDSMDVFTSKIDQIRPRVAKLQYSHKPLLKAYKELQDCARCKVSASSNCKAVENYLDMTLADISH